jgi:hypothetical protein
MKTALKFVVLGGLITGLSLSSQPCALEAADNVQPVLTRPSFQIGLDIRFDADWISFSGNLELGNRDVRTGGNSPVVSHDVELGALPNLLSHTRKSIALIRAIRTTTICLAREWLKD